MNATTLGFVAGALTTGCWLPQVVRTVRLRRAEEISWGYLSVLGTGLTCWLAYGIVVSSVSIIAANAATLAFVISILGLKLKTRSVDRVLEQR